MFIMINFRLICFCQRERLLAPNSIFSLWSAHTNKIASNKWSTGDVLFLSYSIAFGSVSTTVIQFVRNNYFYAVKSKCLRLNQVIRVEHIFWLFSIFSDAPCNDSFSFCGLRNKKYPDARPLGYPFDKSSQFNNLDVASLNEFTQHLPNATLGECSIRFTDTVIDRKWYSSSSFFWFEFLLLFMCLTDPDADCAKLIAINWWIK